MSEVRTFVEGSLRWVQASGSAGGWVTASAPVSATVGFVRAGFSNASAKDMVTIMERGIPSHHKLRSKTPPEVTFTYLEAVTANMPSVMAATAGGASQPLLHFELKETRPELASTAVYYLFTHATLTNVTHAEAEDGNTMAETWRSLAQIGPTGSGYLAVP